MYNPTQEEVNGLRDLQLMLDVRKCLEEYYEIKNSTDIVVSENYFSEEELPNKNHNLFKEVIQRLTETRMQLTALQTATSWKVAYLNKREKLIEMKLSTLQDAVTRHNSLFGSKYQKENTFFQKCLILDSRAFQLKSALNAIRKRRECVQLRHRNIKEKIENTAEKISVIKHFFHL